LISWRSKLFSSHFFICRKTD